MNDEYVSKQSVLELFEILADKMDFSALKVVRQLQGAVIDMVPVDVKTVVCGQWVFDDPLRGDFMCNNCLDRQLVCTRYCPNCGAYMYTMLARCEEE